MSQIIDYFGKDNCSKITRLDLTNVYKKDVYLKNSENAANSWSGEESDDSSEYSDPFPYSADIENVNISELFPNLKHFILSNYCPVEKLNIANLHLPTNLGSLTLSKCRTEDLECRIEGWSSIERCGGTLKSLNISDLAIRDVSFLKNLPLLERINLSNNTIRDLTILNENKKLVSLNLENCLISDISFIKELPLLETFYFGTGMASFPAGMNVLKECPSLKTLYIEFDYRSKKGFYNFFKLPKIEKLHFKIHIEDFNFLTSCTSLKSLHCNISDLSVLENCTELKELNIQPSSIDLSTLPNLEKLEFISLLESTVTNLSALERLPALKKVVLMYCKGVSDEQLVSLISKGITVTKY